MDAGVNELMGRLQNPPGLVELRSRDVVVQLVIDRQLAQRSFPDVPIAIRNARAPWLVDPDNVAIEVRGPAAEIESLEVEPQCDHGRCDGPADAGTCFADPGSGSASRL